MRGFMTMLVALAAACALAPAAGATMTAGPLGGRESETWNVATPPCAIEHDWQKQPTAFDVRSVAFKASISCGSIPPNLTVYGTLNVYDQNAGLSGKRVLTAQASLGPSPSPVSFSLEPVLRSPRAGQVYQSEFLLSFVDGVNFSVQGVSGAPPQCMTHNNTSDPFDPGPIPPGPPSVDCQFLEELVVP